MNALFLSVWDRIQAEPVIVSTLVGAVINCAIVFGAPITVEQKAAIVLVVTSALALFTRSQVSPVP